MSKEIDYTPATHKLNEVLFNVELQQVYSNFLYPGRQSKQPVSTTFYKAIVNQENGHILSVVGNNYRLIPNHDAIEMGKILFRSIYPDVQTKDLISYKVIAPASLASAHIDLIHKDVNFNVWEQEQWLPFLRVSNSYNRTCALSFEIGFVRKLCSNGVLFNKKSMKLKYFHNRNNRLDLNNDINGILNEKTRFIADCINLKNVKIPKELMFALFCQMMGINLNVPGDKQLISQMNYLETLHDNIQSLTDNYFSSMGSTAYAAFNVATDVVSHQEDYSNLRGYYLNVPVFFSRPANWLTEFAGMSGEKNFSITEYLSQGISKLTELNKITGFKWRLN